jgi:hypothetical protein
LFWLLVSASPPVGTSRKTIFCEPDGANTESQYFVPAVSATCATFTEFHDPATGLVIVPWASNVPG